jgi:hypothetical protein
MSATSGSATAVGSIGANGVAMSAAATAPMRQLMRPRAWLVTLRLV